VSIHHLTTDHVSLRVRATPEHLYDLVSDVTRIGEWSPECFRCEWIGGAIGPVEGARFKAWNRRGIARWSNKPTVVAAVPGKEFAFSRTGFGAGEVIWRYRFDPSGDGTTLTESYEVVRDASPVVIWLILKLMRIDDREADLREAMRTTLERIRAIAGSP
jgi:hypothetical protein